MKLRYTLICLLGMSLWLAMPPAGLAAIDISRDGTPQAVIVVAADAGAADRYAAEELAGFLGQVTGAKFALINKLDPGRANLLVGDKAARLADPGFSTEGLGSDGIVIQTAGKDLILAGGEPRGTLYAVYTFLEDQAGCRWWTPAASTIPSRPNLSVGDLSIRYRPPFEYRCTDAPEALDGDWSARNRFNGHWHNLQIRHGGKIAYIASNKWSVHTFWTLLPPEIYFKDHPEWYSLIDGKRTHVAPKYEASSLCLTNDEMRRELVKNQRLALAWNPHAGIISISQVDDAGPPERCQCDKCVAVEKEEGSPSGLMIRFVNSVAEDLEKDYPNLPIDTLAYHYTRKPPLHVKPRANVIVRLCDIECSFARPLADDINKGFRDDLLGWSKICNRLYVWDYVSNFSYPMLPHPNLRVLAANARFLAEHHVTGMFGEAVAERGAELVELRSWVLGKLYWDPKQDAQTLIKEFANGYYGAAGPYIVDYLDTMHDAVESSGDRLGLSSPPDARFLSLAALSKGWASLQSAAEAVKDDPALLARVEAAQLPVRYAFLMKWDELRQQARSVEGAWPMPESMQQAFDQFMAGCRKHDVSPGLLSSLPMTEAMLRCRQASSRE